MIIYIKMKNIIILQITKPNVLLEKYVSKYDRHRFFWNWMSNFQADELLKKHDMFFNDHDYIDMIISRKF